MQEFLYHGSSTADITTFIPHIRSTPIVHKDNPKPAIYATDDKAYAAAHAFLWSSDEGFDTYYKDGNIVLQVPESKKERLDQPVFIYTLPAKSFTELKDIEPIGRNFWSHSEVAAIGCLAYTSVTEAVLQNGGSIVFTI